MDEINKNIMWYTSKKGNIKRMEGSLYELKERYDKLDEQEKNSCYGMKIRVR